MKKNSERPVILVDLDNVVYPWAETMAFFLVVKEATPYTYPELMAKYDKWEVWESWDMPKGEFLRWWRLAVEEEYIYARGTPLKDARDALWKLSDNEWHIHIATARLSKFGAYDTIVRNTAKWLHDENIPYRTLTVTESGTDKHRLLANVLVDDSKSAYDPITHELFYEFGAPHNTSTVTWEDVILDITANSDYWFGR